MSATQSGTPKHALSITRTENFPEWYQVVIQGAELAETSPVRGCMIIKPWGYGIWEKMQRFLDGEIRATGHENAYFPLFIPLSFLEREATHVEGFAKECAVVTHHRLEGKDGRLIPAGPLEEPLVVRPTSETIIGDAFSRWVQSYRDLPLLINQWANVVRWEMRTRLFLRTAEFLWQEGHTAHAAPEEALAETRLMHQVYQKFIEEVLAIPVIPGEKPAFDRFPGAENSFSVEAMMQDGKALQAGTSHYLGQNFANACNILFLNQAGERELAYTTSWGVSTRLIGGLIMTHGDDDGIRIPPRIAPKHVVVIPVLTKPEVEAQVLAYAEEIAATLRGVKWEGSPIEVIVDKRDIRGGDKNWQWVRKGIPIRLEVGPRDMAERKAVLYRRDQGPKEKEFLALESLADRLPTLLGEIQQRYFNDALAYQRSRTYTDIRDPQELAEAFGNEDEERREKRPLGFIRGKWAESEDTDELLAKLKINIICLPLDQSESEGRCLLTGKPAVKDVIYARKY